MRTENLQHALSDLAAQAGFRMVDRYDLPGQEPRYAPLPAGLDGALRDWLARQYPHGLYEHQSQGIMATLAGKDICLATSTASGKSLVFMTAALEVLRKNPTARILAIYPAKALIQDQLEKWQTALRESNSGVTVGYIDGDVRMEQRLARLRTCRVVLMTPDVGHAWLMSHLSEQVVKSFLTSLRLLILDEAHVYEGAFGTNMAYFLRRLQVAAGRHQLIAATATVDDPGAFIKQLTGREVRCFTAENDAAARAQKTVLLAQLDGGKPFESAVALLRLLTREGVGRFLGFVDSRRAVEQIVAATRRKPKEAAIAESDEDDDDDPSEGIGTPQDGRSAAALLMPYRAGYETDDRDEIQRALRKGSLAGVVATSALELGLDIGEIDLVVMLNPPTSMKAFWQRLGRAGRRNPAVCLILDEQASFTDLFGSLEQYVQRPLEPSWIYLENRYIQYANVLCAARELDDLGVAPDQQPYASLPERFQTLLDNELNPSEVVPPDLYMLKQRAQTDPHHEFPMRSATDKNFTVKGQFDHALGNLSFSQVLREAYPGALYYYMARPHRVTYINYRDGLINTKRDKQGSTQPIMQAMVFPRFPGGIHQLLRAGSGFVAEAEMQVSERVTGFTFGSSKQTHEYGPESSYSQRELNRFFETTGVCWTFPDKFSAAEAKRLAECLRDAFCVEFGIQPRDLGVGTFTAKQSPLGGEKCQGVCIFDATTGSLRLTERLPENFAAVVEAALAMVGSGERSDEALALSLRTLLDLARDLRPVVVEGGIGMGEGGEGGDDDQWQMIIAPGEQAQMVTSAGGEEITVQGYRYTPLGLMYDLKPRPNITKRSIPAVSVQPINGQTRMLRVNLMTGEEEAVS